ncbi:hypothetical protein K474DRAFT_1658079 [Panus rudis PR-1116 ss-1]|nr:hypothetical protein K474DRAFT_1658079 [Panus rudis PR-1116 ss-1]
MDVATVRAELKAFERDFRSQHGRDPTVQEIKDRPAIAEKYKLYKKLAKSNASAPQRSASRPSTPPKHTARPSSSALPHKSRAVKTEASPATSNPFSPVKNKPKRTRVSPSPLPPPDLFASLSSASRANPFATPRKDRSRSRLPDDGKRTPHAVHRDPSPDPFPLIQPAQSLSSQQPNFSATNAVTRARKRLRGEPVSPSPVKEKRPRVASQSALLFVKANRNARLHLDDSDASDGPDDDLSKPDEAIIENTPMKPRMGDKAFIQLFQEAPVQQDVIHRPLVRSQSRAKSTLPPSADRTSRSMSRALTPDSGDEGELWNGNAKIKALNFSGGAPRAGSSKLKQQSQSQKPTIPKAMLPPKDDLWSAVGPAAAKRSVADTTKRNNPLKRSSSDVEMEDARESTSRPNTKGFKLPPSPPPTTRPSAESKGKGKAKPIPSAAVFTRKKAKILRELGEKEASDQSEEEDSAEESNVKVLDWSWRRKHAAANKQGGNCGDGDGEGLERVGGSDEDFDPTAPLPPLPASTLPGATEVEENNVEINLPSDLARVLALSPTHEHAQAHKKTEEKVVKELLYGGRQLHYDPKRGGLIYDVGEDAESEGAGEDDWEGEPVPWEVGEL